MRPEVTPRSLMDSNFALNVNDLCRNMIHRYGGTRFNLNGTDKMLDIGGFSTSESAYENSRQYWKMDYHILNLHGSPHPKFIKADIMNCPQIPDNSYDFVYSSDTFEHITKPWLAAKEIARILKPRGLCFVFTVFAWRYHAVTGEYGDYFRYTPFGLMSLFDGYLEHHEANWDGRMRRGLNGIGIQGDGTANDTVPEDMLGAWRENWRVYYMGQKP